MDYLVASEVNFNSVDKRELSGYSEFEGCEFSGCELAGMNFSDIKFVDCKFINSDLSMSSVGATLFRGVEFFSCKLMGIEFNDCRENLLDFSFFDSILNYSVFNGLSLPNTNFIGCKLLEVSFADADLQGTSFAESNLEGAIFSHTCLKSADFSAAENFIIDPDSNILKNAKFSYTNLAGLLSKYNIDFV